MSFGGNALVAALLTPDLIRFVRTPFTIPEAIDTVRQRLAHREQHFLDWVEALVYGNPRSPYRTLLGEAGCELEDLRRLVRRHGLDGALQRLQEAGVYLTYEEFRGREDAVRGSRRFRFDERDFTNPKVRAHFTARTGGTSGRSVEAPADLRFVEYLSTRRALVYAAHGLEGMPAALWLPGPPDVVWFREVLFPVKLGLPPPQRWFSPTPVHPRAVRAIAAVGVPGFRMLGRLLGHAFPAPEYVPLDQAEGVARWLAGTIASHGAALLRTRVSLALEVAKSANRTGLDLSRAVFYAGGEPVTAARRAQLESTGARVIPSYGAEELGGGPVAHGCAAPQHPDDVHLFTDQVALIRHRREHQGTSVEPFLFTSLHPLAPKLLINVEIDDAGTVEERPCGCFMGEMGLTTHLHGIQSFGKLTAYGRSVVSWDIVRILEEVLPQRFGGSASDYQLVEEEAESGATELALLINSQVGALDPREVVSALLSELRQGRPAYQITSELWRQAETITVERRPPIVTWRGKVLPLHFTSRSRGASLLLARRGGTDPFET